MLDECGWEAQFQSTATTKAKQQPVLDVPSLIDALTPHAKGRHLPHTASSQELLLTVFVRAIRHAATPRQGASAREASRLFGPKPRRCLVAPPHPISYPYPARLPSGAQCKTQQSADQRVLTRARPTQKQKGQHAKRSRGAARADSRSSTSLAPPSRCLPSDTPGPLVDTPKRTTQRQPKLRAEMVGLPTLRLTSACNASCHGTMGEEGVSAGLNANVLLNARRTFRPGREQTRTQHLGLDEFGDGSAECTVALLVRLVPRGVAQARVESARQVRLQLCRIESVRDKASATSTDEAAAGAGQRTHSLCAWWRGRRISRVFCGVRVCSLDAGERMLV
ncbi:hypothetical protein L1887_45955 [Cichorium endivia]|nr:hypothetical protein L1887_45955 [Cichorium endivia]